jgi:hypothetical protein
MLNCIAEGGNRTLTRGEPDGILNPARLPVPPLRPSNRLFIIDGFLSIANDCDLLDGCNQGVSSPLYVRAGKTFCRALSKLVV